MFRDGIRLCSSAKGIGEGKEKHILGKGLGPTFLLL
jgi:hypothetical protein